MKLNKEIIKKVLKYVIDHQDFDLDKGMIKPIELIDLINTLTHKTEDDEIRKEYSYAIALCINENLIESNYPDVMWGRASITSITFKGYEWIENN